MIVAVVMNALIFHNSVGHGAHSDGGDNRYNDDGD